MEVTAVDRSRAVLKEARNRDDTKRVKFIRSDLMEISFPACTFDAVIVLETLGLQSKSDDERLLKKAYSWLKPGGQIVVDCPLFVSRQNEWTKSFDFGTVSCVSGFNPKTRIQDIDFKFTEPDGYEFGLLDPYDLERGNLPGIQRYIYEAGELYGMISESKFRVRGIPHYYKEGYYALIGTKPGKQVQRSVIF